MESTRTPTQVWHHELHNQFARERLCFFWISFGAHYERRPALAQIKRALQSVPILSYAVWELLGEQDLLIRIFLPVDIHPDDLRDRLSEAIVQPHAADVNFFTVSKVLYHWMSARYPVSVSDFLRTVDPSHTSELNDHKRFPAASLAIYTRKHFVFPLATDGLIPFFMRISEKPEAAPMVTERDFEGELIALFKKASRYLNRVGIFKGIGFRSRYLVSALIEPESWPKLRDVLSEGVLGLDKYAKTVTHLSARPKPIDRREQLKSEVVGGVHTTPLSPALFEGLVDGPETKILELKGTAFIDVKRWRDTGEPQKSNVITQSLVKVIAGMLNTVGGRVIVGVLELSSKEISRFTVDQIKQLFPDLQVTPSNKRAVIGVSHEYGANDWDGYDRRIREILNSRIDPPPTRWLEIETVPIFGLDCCVVTVSRHRSWFFVKGDKGKDDTFYIRDGSITKPLTGSKMIEYMEKTQRV